MSKVKLLLDVIDDMRSLADSLQAVADAIGRNEPEAETVAPDPAPAPAPQAPPPKAITLEEVRAVLAEKSHDGFTTEVRELLQKYGAAKLSGIAPANYAALLKDAEVLGNAS